MLPLKIIVHAKRARTILSVTPHAEHASHASASSHLHGTAHVIEREVLLVDIVEHAQKRHPVFILEKVVIAAHLVMAVSAITCEHAAKPSGRDAHLCEDVDCALLIAVRKTCKFRLVALLVVHLYFAHHVGSYVAQSHCRVRPEKLLAVDKHPLHLLAARRD